MKRLIKIDPIAVKNKNEVVKALEILEKIGISTLTDKQKKSYLADETKEVNNNFLIQEKDGGFRVQSHYLGHGISLESLESQVNNLLEKYPDICEKLNQLDSDIVSKEKEIDELKKKIKKMNAEMPTEFPDFQLTED